MKALEHFKTITHHRHLVMGYCFKLGLYRQGLLHDLSKYAPVEFLVGCKYYQGTRSPNNAEQQVYLWHGYTIKDVISIILNIGLTMECHQQMV